MSESLYFEDLYVGQSWRSFARTITETDVVQFAGMTGDYDPLHVDHHFARQTPFGRPIAHGLLGLSILAGLGIHSPRVQTAAFVAIENWRFLKPIFFGDTVHAVNEVVALAGEGRRRGRVTWKRGLVNQDGAVVQEGLLITLVNRRSPLGREVKREAADAVSAEAVTPEVVSSPTQGRAGPTEVRNTTTEGRAGPTEGHSQQPPSGA